MKTRREDIDITETLVLHNSVSMACTAQLMIDMWNVGS